MTLAQAPEDAEYDGMPKAAIATGMVDFILNAVDMPQRLLELWSQCPPHQPAQGCRAFDGCPGL